MSFLVFMPNCEYPRWVAAVFLPQNLFMLILFLDFYIKTYIKKPQLLAAKGKISNSHKGNDIVDNTNENLRYESTPNNVKVDSQLNGNGKIKTH